MRFVTRQYNNKPRKLTLRTTIVAWNNIATTGNKAAISPDIYRDPYRTHDGTASRVIEKLNTWYHYKCAYCERIYKLDVEHYRPNSEVRDENNAIVQVPNNAAILINHPGYYWLCYEWSNLIPACPTCNRPDGKTSRFPTIHHYESNPIFLANGLLDNNNCLANSPVLTGERPYLLHPEVDVPDGVFVFVVDPDKKGIRIEGVDHDRRGEFTADICKLNRDEVRYDRVHKVILPIKKVMLSYLKLLATQRKTINEFRDLVDAYIQKLYDDAHDETLDHTLLRKFIVQNRVNFDAIVLPYMPKRISKIVKEAFRNYIPL